MTCIPTSHFEGVLLEIFRKKAKYTLKMKENNLILIIDEHI